MGPSNHNSTISIGDALTYLKDGLSLALSKECRLFVIIPIIINFVVLFAGGSLLFHFITSTVNEYIAGLPSWLSFLSYLVWFITVATLGFIFAYIFSTIATIIASPFYGMLAERAETVIRGQYVGNDDGIKEIIKDLPRILKRELQKLWFYIPRMLLCVIIMFIPVVNLISPICWFLLASWMMSVQYVDYAYDNHKVPFATMRHDLAEQKFATFGIGAIVSLAMAVPLLNLLVPPAAVCAGTKYYVEITKRYSDVPKVP